MQRSMPSGGSYGKTPMMELRSGIYALLRVLSLAPSCRLDIGWVLLRVHTFGWNARFLLLRRLMGSCIAAWMSESFLYCGLSPHRHQWNRVVGYLLCWRRERDKCFLLLLFSSSSSSFISSLFVSLHISYLLFLRVERHFWYHMPFLFTLLSCYTFISFSFFRHSGSSGPIVN